MKLLSLLTFLLIPLAGCTTLSQIGSTYAALTDLTVPAQTVIVAANAFDAVEAAATQYLVYCTPDPSPAGCDDNLIKSKVIPAVSAGIQARDGLEGFLKTHPGALGSRGLMDALVSATSILTSMSAQFAAAQGH